MPESVIPDQYVQQIPRFTLPPEVTGEPKPDIAPKTEAPAAPAAEAEPKKPAESAPASESKPKPEDKPEGKAEGEDKETTGKDPDKAGTRRFERRIANAIRARAQAEARAEAAERKAAELEAKTAAQTAPQPRPGAPKIEDFTDAEEYANAKAEFVKQEALRELKEKEQAEAHARSERELTQSWSEQVVKGESQYDDWDEVVGDLKPTTPWAVALMHTDNGADVAYYLGQHDKEMDRIVEMPPARQFIEIGRIAQRLASAEKAPPKPSQAPPPIAPVAAASAGPVDEIRPGQSFEEYMKIGNRMFRGER